MRVLVTGGAGYIGSVVVEQLLARGAEVVVLDNFRQGHAKAVVGAEIIHCDVYAQEPDLRAHMMRNRPEAVIHLAALVSVEDSVKHPVHYYEDNLMGTFHVLDAMRRARVPRLVYASSAAVYGDLPGQVVTEAAIPMPVNVYGETKLWGELMCRDFARQYGWTGYAFRFFNVAGATERNGEYHSPETHLFPCVLQAALENLPIQVYGTDWPTKDGTALRDFIHVSDIARALVEACHTDRKGFGVYNLGTGQAYTVKEVISAIERASGRTIPIDPQPRRTGDVVGLWADPQKALGELGWRPIYALEDMARSAWAWASAHPEGYDG